MTTNTILTDEEIIGIGNHASAIEPGENGHILPVTQKGDMRLKDGKLWVCSDPDINRWVCPDDRGWQLVPVEPTDEMKKAGCRVPLNKAARHNACYKVMLSAAPKFGEKKMTTETILTPTQVDSLLDGVLRSSGSRLGNYTLQKTLDELRSAVRAIEQAVLQSPEVQALKRDKERLDWLAYVDNRIGNVQLPTVCVERNPHSLRDAIDEAMEYKK